MDSNDIELVCQEVVELVTEYLGGTLSPTDRERFDQHLATCPPCTAYLTQMRTTLDLASEVGASPDPADDQIANQLADIFRHWHAKRKP